MAFKNPAAEAAAQVHMTISGPAYTFLMRHRDDLPGTERAAYLEFADELRTLIHDQGELSNRVITTAMATVLGRWKLAHLTREFSELQGRLATAWTEHKDDKGPRKRDDDV